MTVTTVDRDTETLTLTISAEFSATAERVWQLWADPRQLERWWGPPTYPATVEQHELVPGGRVVYAMTGPEGDVHKGYWEVLGVEEPTRIEIRDGFADEHGAPDAALPEMTMRVTISEDDGTTRMTISTRFATVEAMERVLEMGMAEGMSQALGQIDAILAED